jgi:hypothetical protein
MEAAAMRGLDGLARVDIPSRVVVGTQEDLREIGQDGNEGFALWIGNVVDRIAYVKGVLLPPQTPIKNEDGVGYLLDSSTLFAINQFLAKRQMRLIAQIHTHPTEAYHSAMDDKYAIVTVEGGFSLVIPDFARGPADIMTWAHYRLLSGHWQRMTEHDVTSLFELTK